MIRARKSPGRILAAVLVAALLAVEVARLTIASAVADTNPERAARLAPGMPAALSSQAMADVGHAAAIGGNPDARTMERLQTVAETAPLDTEPFLVHAALAERAGKLDLAKGLLDQALLRDPRSTAAHYLYADVAIRQGNVAKGLTAMAVLSRLLPAATVQLVPALAQFARTPGSQATLGGVLAQNPQLKQPLLLALASDSSNADLVLALAGPQIPQSSDSRAWQGRLVGAFVKKGDYQQGYALWRHFAGLPQGAPPLLFNGDFQRLSAPTPFNWNFSGGDAGVAEADNGHLRILYYGRDNATFATELLLLAPGQYRFDAPVTGQLAPQALVWTLTCADSSATLLQLQLTAPGQPAANFTVPASKCPAQRLQLSGQSQEMPQDTDVQIGPLQIERIGG